MNNYAYLTFLSSDSYVYYVLALYESWQKTNSKYNFYCVVTEDVSEKIKKILAAAKIPQINLDTADITATLKACRYLTKSTAYINSTKKLKFFSLTQFEKCLYIDSDMIILQNIDHLFDYPDFAAVEDTITDTLIDKYKYFNGMTIFNGGLFVFSPATDFYNQILADLKNLPDIDIKWRKINGIYNGWQDQNILAWYNKDWLQNKKLQLPLEYNFAVKFENYRDYKDKLFKVKIKHFINNKTNIVQKKAVIINDLIYQEWVHYVELINQVIKKYKLDLDLLDTKLLIKQSTTKQRAIKKQKETNKENIHADGRPGCYLYF